MLQHKYVFNTQHCNAYFFYYYIQTKVFNIQPLSFSKKCYSSWDFFSIVLPFSSCYWDLIKAPSRIPIRMLARCYSPQLLLFKRMAYIARKIYTAFYHRQFWLPKIANSFCSYMCTEYTTGSKLALHQLASSTWEMLVHMLGFLLLTSPCIQVDPPLAPASAWNATSFSHWSGNYLSTCPWSLNEILLPACNSCQSPDVFPCPLL